MKEAWKRVKANGGADGIDKVIMASRYTDISADPDTTKKSKRSMPSRDLCDYSRLIFRHENGSSHFYLSNHLRGGRSQEKINTMDAC